MKKRIFLLVFNIFLWMNIGVAEVRNISLNFSNTKIRNLIDIVSKVTRKSFIFDEKHLAGKKITLIAQKKFTASEAYAVFEYILKINDLLTINEGKVVRILPSNLARREATPILKANDKSKDNDYVTHIIEAKNTSITQLRSSISQLISKTGTIGVYPPGNLLIIRDLRKNIKRIVKLVQLFDESSGEVQVAIIALKYANARVVLSIVNRIFVQTGRKYSSPSKPVLTLDPRNNRIFVAGNQTAIRKVKKMVAILDQSADEQRKITLVEILHSDAKNVARILNKVFKGSSKKNKKQHKQEIIALERSNHLLVIGTPPFTARVKKMVEDLDQASESLVLEIIPVKNAEAESLATLLEGIFQKSTSSKKTNTKQIQVFADKRTNKLLILANKSSLKKIKNIIKELDIPTGGGGMIGNFRVFQLKNAKSKHVAEVLQKVSGSFQQLGKKNKKSKSTISSSSNSSGFKIVADEETNSIVVFAQPTQFLSIERVIQRLDIVRPQVFFEALIMEVTIDKTFSLNINWQANALTQSGSNRGMITMNDPNSRGVPTGLSSTLPTGQENSSFGLLGPIINFNGVEFPSFQSFVKAVQKNTNIDILSNPQLLTMANQEATINVGETRPFIKEITIDSNNNERQSVEYRDVGIKLKILPQVNANNTITLKIDETTSEVKTGTLDSDKFPITLTRTINTSVTIADGKTVVLGGLINDTIDISETKTPCLGDIPLLGWFFKGKSKTRKKTNLLVFITPRIIRTKEDLKKISFRTSERFKSSKKGNFRVNVAKEFRMPSLVKEPKKRKALEREIWEYQEGK